MHTITTIGLDIAKSVFQVHGVDAAGQVVIRRQLKRRHVLAFFQKLSPCVEASLKNVHLVTYGDNAYVASRELLRQEALRSGISNIHVYAPEGYLSLDHVVLFLSDLTGRNRLKQNDPAMQSLFVIALPRSLSSKTYTAVQTALGLKAPSWTTAGEILNVDRYVQLPEQADDMGAKFTLRERDPVQFDALSEFLNQVTAPAGFAYKDVVQPFVVAEWLRSHPQYRVLRIKRRLPDVAFAMLAMRWLYPCRAASDSMQPTDSLIAGLIRADRAMDAVPGEHVHFDDLIAGGNSLRIALTALYPGIQVRVTFDDSFFVIRDQILQRRNSDQYKQLEQKVFLAMANT